MKKTAFLLILFVSFLLISCKNEEQPKAQNDKVISSKKLRHIVLFKFKDGTSKDSIAIAEKAFADLPNKIKEIKNFEWGTNNSPENFDKGFTHSFVLTFDSEKGREVYLPHPDHKAFGEVIGPILDDVLVIDYWAKD